MYRTGRGGETRGGKIDLQDIASRLERANDDSGRYLLEGPGPALLCGGLVPALFEADVKNITNGYEEELDHLLRSKGHQGMQPVSMTKMLETKKGGGAKAPAEHGRRRRRRQGCTQRKSSGCRLAAAGGAFELVAGLHADGAVC